MDGAHLGSGDMCSPLAVPGRYPPGDMCSPLVVPTYMDGAHLGTCAPRWRYMDGAHLGTCVVLLVHGGVVHQTVVQWRRQTRNQPVWLARRVILQHGDNTAHGTDNAATRERRPAHPPAAQTLLPQPRISSSVTSENFSKSQDRCRNIPKLDLISQAFSYQIPRHIPRI